MKGINSMEHINLSPNQWFKLKRIDNGYTLYHKNLNKTHNKLIKYDLIQINEPKIDSQGFPFPPTDNDTYCITQQGSKYLDYCSAMFFRCNLLNFINLLIAILALIISVLK